MRKAAQNTTTQRNGDGDVNALQAALGAWYAANRRKLPWREAPSLYKTVVSEFMLQQTQVVTVLPYFARWLEKFPDFASLAAAKESVVLKMWEGLGYYRRARLLHALARELAQLPAAPRRTEAWRELPGVGPYTAAAITSISFGAPAAVVDGNVVRVLARLNGEKRQFKDGSDAVKFFTPAAEALLNAHNPGDHNQAMMELGATVCTRHNPTCLICPWLNWCAAAKQGLAEELPRFATKPTRQTKVMRLWIERDGALLLHRKTANSKRLANLCELPDAASLPKAKIEKAALAIKRRTIANEQFTESIHRAKIGSAKLGADFLWATPQQLAKLTLSGPHRRWISELRAPTNT